jgi:chemotaxis response regulator CheB
MRSPRAPDGSRKTTAAAVRPQCAAPRALPDGAEPAQGSPFPIVGVGASAGGLEAFTELLSHLPNDAGIAFLLIQRFEGRAAFSVEEEPAEITVASARPSTTSSNRANVAVGSLL